MTKKLRILSAIASLCFLGSIACFSGYAAEFMNNPSGEEVPAVDPGYVDPGVPTVDPGYVEPDPGYVDPGTTTSTYVDPNPGYVDPGTTTSTYVDPNPGYVDPGTATSTYVDPNPGYVDPNPGYVTSEYSYQPYNYDNYSYYNTTSYYMDYNSQYTQYIENTYQAQYDDNYYYVPSYTAPAESLIEVSSKPVDTDELTRDDWHKIMMDLSNGNVKESNTQTFNFIKENVVEGDTSVEWMLYVGIVLILMSLFTVVFVVISTNKAKDNSQLKVAI